MKGREKGRGECSSVRVEELRQGEAKLETEYEIIDFLREKLKKEL